MVTLYNHSKQISFLVFFLFLSAKLFGSDVIKPVKPTYGFIENKGQIMDQEGRSNPDVKFLLCLKGLNIQLKNNSFSYDTYTAEEYRHPGMKEPVLPSDLDIKDVSYKFHRIDIEFIGANLHPVIVPEFSGSDYINFVNPLTPESGVQVKHFGKVTYKDLYPGIDLEFIAKPGTTKPVEYNFIVHPGADASLIKWQYNGSNSTALLNGMLQISTSNGKLTESIPSSFEKESGEKVNVKYKFFVDGIYQYNCETYSDTKTLIIDPVPDLKYGTYYGETGDDRGYGIYYDASGNIFVTGASTSTLTIATAGSYQSVFGGNGTYQTGGDIYLAAFNSSGTRIWATYYGGTGNELGQSIRVDGSGIYIEAMTTSTTGMSTAGAFQAAFGSGTYFDAMLCKFSLTGSRLWSTYYGGSGNDRSNPNCLVLDASGNVYIAGTNNTVNGSAITTAGCYQSTNLSTSAYDEPFVAKFSPTGTIIWGTYYGGTLHDQAYALALDASNNVYLTGAATSTTLIATTGAYQTALAGGTDAFIAKLNSTGTALLWATYYGGTGTDVGQGISVDASGNITVTGYTTSTTGISTTGAYQTAFGGGAYDGFVVKFNATGTRQWGTYYGSTLADIPRTGRCDASGNLYISGSVTSTTGIATTGAFQSTWGGGNYDGFITKINSSGVPVWGTYYGGALEDNIYTLEVDQVGNIWLAGITVSTSGLTSTGAYQTTFGGGLWDGIFAKFSEFRTGNDAGVLSIDSPALFCSGTQNIKVTIKNYGKNQINPVKVNWSLDGVTQTAYNYTTILDTVGGTGNTAQITLGSYPFTTVPVLLKVWTSSPNNVPDTVPYNDTMQILKAASLNGSYTIDPAGTGINNFTSFTAAASSLNSFGVCGPVVFTVASGVYNEKVTLGIIPGVSSINTIVFDGVDSATRKLTFNETAVPANPGVINIQGANYVTFKNLGITALGTSTGIGVNIQTGNYNNILNCNIRVSSASTSTSCFGIGICGTTYSSASAASNNLIRNCNIIGGVAGIALYGTSTTVFASGNVIRNCTISEVYNYGIYSYYQTFDTIVDNRMTVRLTAIANYGIYSYYNQNVRMERNYIYGFSYMGIYAYYNNSSATVRMAIANNIINLNGPYIYTTQQGINAVTCNTVDIIHNTVYTVGAGSGSYACNITPGTAGVVIKNNIFHSTGSSSGALSVSTPTGLTACDHNILFSNFTTLATWAAANYIDVASLRSASAPYNVNTFNKFSNFVSVVNQAENLHLTSTVAADYGDANYSTALDFDGETRCAFAPTIGADESKFGSGVPTANFTQSDTIFVNSPVTLLNNNGVGSPLTHKWYIDGVFKGSTVDLPCQFSATGSYSIKLVTTGCFGIDSITRSITVFNATQAPIANFISDVNTVETYQNVTFKDLTVKGPTYWNWSFVPSTGVNYNFSTTNHSSSPIVNFSNPGLYQVCLWDSNDVGRSNTECKTAYILVRSTSTMCIFPFDTKVSSGTLYDDGGPNGNYGPNHLAANPCNFLIDPCASSVTLSFSSFNLGLNAFLKVYDGKDKYGTPLHTAAGVPNGFTGTTFPPTLTASSGKMYIEFITATTLAPGFAATWSSVAGNYPVPSGTVNFPDTLYDCGAMTDFTFVPNNPLFEKDGAYYRWYFDYDHSAIADIEGKGYYTTQWAYSSLGSYIIRCEVEGCGGTLVLQDTVYVAHPSGPPVINFNADITTATTNDVVTLSDLSRNGPVARKWKITGPSIPSTVSGNTTTKTYAVRFTAPGYYSVSLRDSNCISSDSLTKTNYIKIINYCTPAVSTLNPDFALERTKFGRTDTIVNNTVPGFQYINSTPALGTIAYRDNTDKFAAYNIGNVSITKSVEAIVDLGGTFSFATTRVSNYNKANFNIWIDYDQDGVFQSTELVASSGPIPGRTFSGNITIPLNAKIGNTRMRIATAFNNSSNTPCGANQYGEFNDFRIRVIPDMIKPVISFTGSDTLYVEVGRTFVEPGFSVTDNTTIPCPYTVTGIASGTQIVKHPSNFSYMVTATDATGNTSTRTRVVRSSPDITKPVITRIGTSPYYVEVKGIYNDSGATASDFFFGNFTPYIFSIMNVDVNKLGTYGVTYDVTDSSGNKATQVIRTVIVRDTQKPVITLNTADTIYLNVFAPFVPPVVTVTDNYNTGLTYTTTGGPVNNSVIGTYVLNYNATDSSGNSALTKKLTVIVRDTKAPSILLNFGDTFVIDVNTMTTVPEPGYTLSDNYYQSGALNLVVSYANVILNIVGYYPVRYYITDPSGNMDSSHIRVYKIVDRTAPVISIFGATVVVWPRWKPYVDAGNLVTDNYYTNLLCTPDISKVNIYLPGIYEVTFDITDPSGNKAKQEKRNVQITADANGIAGKNDDNLFAVYPNPNNGMVNIDLNIAGTKEGSILIFDATGRIVYTSSKVNPADTKLQLDLSNEAAGMYFIKVVTESYSASKTFSIQH